MKRIKLGASLPKWLKEGRDYVREMVRIRDKRKCRDCRKSWRRGIERRLDVHHLNGLCGKNSRGYDSVKNLKGMITLCKKCHRKRHYKTSKEKYGKPVLRGHKTKVLDMRWEGLSYDKIGKHFGVSSQAVYFFVNGRK